MECSLCSMINFFFGCIYSFASCALDYPAVILLLSALIAIILVTNVHTAKMVCSLTGAGASCSRSNLVSRSCSRRVQGNRAHLNVRDFDYGPQHGPHTWACPQTNQSPINIIDDFAQKFPIRELLTWNHYDDLPCAVLIENTGHTVIVRACFDGNSPTLSGADLLACYTFVELCFRWSAYNNEGSEHMINYKKYPLEVQAMHRTGPASDCTSSYDLLMVSYFYEISNNNPYLNPIVQNLHRIQKPGTKVEIAPFPISYLCHQFRSGFYSYGGSLTQPPCYEGAEWFVFPEPLAVSEQQLHEFRQLLSVDGKTRIQRNARPVQTLNCTRIVNFNQYNPVENGVAPMSLQDTDERACDDDCLSN